MNAEEIRQRAISCADQYNGMCELADDRCTREDGGRCPYYSEDTTKDCAAIYGYERGFADGAEGARRRIYEEYMKAAKADSEASMHGDMFPKNVEIFWQELKGE